MPTFLSRSAALTSTLGRHIPTVQPAEVDAIRAAYAGEEERLAALEALARPRLAYAWTQAGGPNWQKVFTDVSQAAFEAAHEYYLSHYCR